MIDAPLKIMMSCSSREIVKRQYVDAMFVERLQLKKKMKCVEFAYLYRHIIERGQPSFHVLGLYAGLAIIGWILLGLICGAYAYDCLVCCGSDDDHDLLFMFENEKCHAINS